MTVAQGPIELLPKTWWVGELLPEDNFQCHVYLIDQGDQSVLIDPGSLLVADAVTEMVDEVVGIGNVRWLVCSHPDPDVIGAVPRLQSAGLPSDAAIVTHWRNEALLKHLNWGLPFWLIEQHDWRLELPDSALSFVLTPYAHFAGAFCTFDEGSGAMFTSDLFGAFCDDLSLIADEHESLEGLRTFHEHYMPSREAVNHALDQMAELPITMIAPQHGKVLPGPLIERATEELRDLEVGLYLDVAGDPGLDFLFMAHRTMQGLTEIMLDNPSFQVVGEHLQQLTVELLGGQAFEIWAAGTDRMLRFDDVDGFAGRPGEPTAEVRSILAEQRRGIGQIGGALHVPLMVPDSDVVDGVAVVPLAGPVELDDRATQLLEDVAALAATAVRREVARRVIELERAAIYEQAVHDSLTGLHNRHFLDDSLPALVARAERDLTPLSVLMVDVDHFKHVNDTFGHQVGDEVLRRLGGILERTVRDGDLAARYGGEEFIVVLPDTSSECAVEVAERIRAEIASPAEGLPDVTASVGVASYVRGHGILAFVERADRALYSAKEAGRDRVHVFERDVAAV